MKAGATIDDIKKYSINLMWINLKSDESKPYIASSYDTEEKLEDNLLRPAAQWLLANPEAEVNIWYDSQFVTKKQLEATKSAIAKKASTDPSYKFNLKDIRDLEVVKTNPDVFTDNVPPYFRIDLLKLIICLHSIEYDHCYVAIFSDLDLGDGFSFTKDYKVIKTNRGRMSKADLFKPALLEKMNKTGLLAAQALGCYVENQFFQVMNKDYTINAIKTYINTMLAYATTALVRNEEGLYSYLNEVVFHLMYHHLFALIDNALDPEKTKIEVRVGPNGPWEPYDMMKHGYQPFGNYYAVPNSNRSLCILPDLTKDSAIPVSDRLRISDSEQYYKREVNLENYSHEIRKIRGPGVHFPEKLVRRPPANGKQYQFQPIELSVPTAQNSPEEIEELKVVAPPPPPIKPKEIQRKPDVSFGSELSSKIGLKPSEIAARQKAQKTNEPADKPQTGRFGPKK